MRFSLVAAVVFAVLAVSASASAGVKDPRVCSLTRSTKAETQMVCARAAAVMAMRRYLRADVYQGPTSCVNVPPTPLRWACTFGSLGIAGSGTVSVVYRGTPNGWKQTVTLTSGGLPVAATTTAPTG